MRTELALIALLPHPDDEFAILPLLERANAEGRAIHLVWLTDGAFGGVDPEARRRESLRALRSVGVQPETVAFVGIDGGIPDGRLHLSMAEAHAATVAALDAVDGPAELLLPAWEGGHQDHDAAHALGRAVARSRGFPMLQYPVYQGEGLRGPVFRALAPLRASTVVRAVPVGRADIGRLVRACLHYRSQWRSFVGLLPMVLLRLLLARSIVLCAVDPTAPLRPPHGGPLLYERRTSWRWPDLQAAVRPYWSSSTGAGP
jgi:LmbE family N-acetylglucosaminyl deacetylase